MNEIPSPHETPAEPHSATSEKPPIRKSQEEFIDDTAGPSIDKSEYEPGHPDTSHGSNKAGRSDTNQTSDASNTIKDPDTWTTGDEPATGAQLSYLKTLSTEAKSDFDENAPLTKAEASKRIETLRQGNTRVQESA